MKPFTIKRYTLSHHGVIPGARGHKKEIVPVGTEVFCITYGRQVFWCAYQNLEMAEACMDGLEASLDGRAKRQIPLDTMIAWNFKPTIPSRVARIKQ